MHDEEMLGVLVLAARPGQRSPDVALAANLIVTGLAIRARRAVSWLIDAQDALAAVSLIAPVLMFVYATLTLGVQTGSISTPFWRPWVIPFLGGPAAAMIGWLAVVVLGLTGRRRTAAGIAFVLLALALLNLLTYVLEFTGAYTGGLPMGFWTAGRAIPGVMASLATCSLAFSAGPRRGLVIVGRRRLFRVLAGFSAAFGFPLVVEILNPDLQSRAANVAVGIFSALVIAAAMVIARVRGTVDKRFVVLLASGLLVNIVGYFTDTITAAEVIVVLDLMLALVVWPVAIASWRGRAPRAAAR